MSVLRRLLCVVRLGHRWHTRTDAAGSLVYCVRCDTIRRAEGDVGHDPGDHDLVTSVRRR
ncbi:MAG: hypothetical protein M3364_01150 [Actinomycetota bacterium]|nr:hypothetical protein [Actinomycetota bacterium]